MQKFASTGITDSTNVTYVYMENHAQSYIYMDDLYFDCPPTSSTVTTGPVHGRGEEGREEGGGGKREGEGEGQEERGQEERGGESELCVFVPSHC